MFTRIPGGDRTDRFPLLLALFYLILQPSYQPDVGLSAHAILVCSTIPNVLITPITILGLGHWQFLTPYTGGRWYWGTEGIEELSEQRGQ